MAEIQLLDCIIDLQSIACIWKIQQTYAQLEANPAAVSVERLYRMLRALDVDLTLAPGQQLQRIPHDAGSRRRL
jgi:hypothetical protein